MTNPAEPRRGFTLARKLALAAGLPTLMLVLIAAFSLRVIDHGKAELLDLAREDMPIAVMAGEVDGNLMDQVIEYEKVLRATWAIKAGDAGSKALLEASINEFKKLTTGSETAFKTMSTLAAAAKVSDDPAVVATYADIERRIKAIDEAQTGFEAVAAQLFKHAAEGRHVEAVQMSSAVETALAKAERETAELVGTINKVTEANVQAAEAYAAQARWLLMLAALAAMALSVVSGVWVTRSITGPATAARDTARRIADGDLTGEVPVGGGDEMGELLAAMRQMQTSLVKVVSEVRGNAESVATASAQIAQGNLDLSQRTEEQASSLQQTAATMEELGTTVRLNADNAQQANQLAQAASDVAVKGGDVVGQVVETMKGISESSRKISDIIGTIDGIAFQTNILALNAAVEAARAGEQGRGFAVVASEVRSLAQRSAEAAKEIKSLIGSSAERVEQGTALVDQAGQTMDEVVASIRRVTDIMGEISSASTEQSGGIAQVGQAVSQMDQVTQQNAALVEESAAAAQSLKVQAGALVQVVGVFKLAQGGRAFTTPAVDAPPHRSAAEHHGKVRGRTDTRPASGKTAAAPRATARPASTEPPAKAPAAARPAEPAPQTAGTDDGWSTF